MRLDNIAKELDAAVIELEKKARGVVHIASIDDQICFIESFGRSDCPEDWKAFGEAVLKNDAFIPLLHSGRPEDNIKIEARLTYTEWQAALDIEVEPERMYGSRMTVRWSPLKRNEESPDVGTWEWQDMNAIARHVIGYAIMDSQTRNCFTNWTFLSN